MYRHNRAVLAVILTLLISLSVACKRVEVQHPNALNSFDSYAYDTLVVAKASLVEAKVHVAEYPQYRKQLNEAIASYNLAESSYRAWRSAKLSGVDSPEDVLALKEQLSGVAAQVRTVMKLFRLKIEEIVGGGL